jgi:CRP/FNR family transcriptional regulator
MINISLQIMYNEVTDHIQKFSSVFEPVFLPGGIKIDVVNGGQNAEPRANNRAVPLVVSGSFKVSRINDEGQELLLYYVKRVKAVLCHLAVVYLQRDEQLKRIVSSLYPHKCNG